MNQAPLPTGQEIELVAIAMASNDGIVWPAATKDEAGRYRRLANIALLRIGIYPDLQGMAVVHRTMVSAVDDIRAGAQLLESRQRDREDEDRITSLYRAAGSIEMIAKILAGDLAEPEQPPEGEF